MNITIRSSYQQTIRTAATLSRLKSTLICASLFNLFIVACLGLTLRSTPFFQLPLSYTYLLHGHSHFAFGGWVMPALLWCIMKLFPELSTSIAFKHWRNISFLMLISAYGMLFSFPVQGYGPVSIIFSTLSIAAGVYLAIVIWKKLPEPANTSQRFLKAGLFYLVLSSIGPFATGPLTALGHKGSVIYNDAIYFYLHFQYNGWFTFAVLSLFYRNLENYHQAPNGYLAFILFNLSVIPSFLLSTLWSHPPLILNLIGGLSALLQISATYLIFLDFLKAKYAPSFSKSLIIIALSAFAFKNVLQYLSAFPSIADLAYHSRNFIIAYLHLVLLGFVTLFIMSIIFQLQVNQNAQMKRAIIVFIIGLATTESLLVLQASGILLHVTPTLYYQSLWLCSILFPLSAFLLFRAHIVNARLQTNHTPIIIHEQSNSITE